MTQAKILYWLEGKPQIGQDTGGRGRDWVLHSQGERLNSGGREGQSPLWTAVKTRAMSPWDERIGTRVSSALNPAVERSTPGS